MKVNAEEQLCVMLLLTDAALLKSQAAHVSMCVSRCLQMLQGFKDTT